MNPVSIRALLKKEISDIFRDKKTLFMMVVIPLVLYPLMIIGMTALMSSIMTNQKETVYKVAFTDIPFQKEMTALLEDKEQDFTYKIEVTPVEDASKALADGKIDAYISFLPKDKTKAAKEAFVTDETGVTSLNGTLQITYYEANDDSNTASKAAEDLINAYQDVIRTKNIRKLKLDEDAILYPVPYKAVGLSSVEETVGNMVGSVIPMMIIVSILMGAMYPAIDVTAGEKERGTLETLLTLPVTNLEMIMSKFLAVSVISCVSAVLNIISMGAACVFMMSMIGEENGAVEINFTSYIPAVMITVIVMIAFALFVTAVCMCVCVFAKSFKEANNYITPVMLVFMFGGFAAMVPNLELSTTTAAIPVVNVALSINDLFQFKYDYALLGIVFVTNVIYSLITVMILGRIYNSEAILFSEGLSSVKFIRRRSEMKKGQMPGYGDMILLCCVTMLLYLYFGSWFQVRFGVAGIVMTQAIIIGTPLLYAWYIKSGFKKLFSLKVPGPLQLLGSFCLWVGGYGFLMLISVILSLFMKESVQNVNKLFEDYMKLPVLVLALLLAVLPAICEEIMFRGFLFGTMRTYAKRLTAILVVSAIFGIYHMSLIRFITTSLLGIIFAYAVSETDSIFCSMLMHFCNNLVSVLMMKYQKEMKEVLPVLFKETLGVTDVCIVFIVSAAAVLCGLWLLRKSRSKAWR